MAIEQDPQYRERSGRPFLISDFASEIQAGFDMLADSENTDAQMYYRDVPDAIIGLVSAFEEMNQEQQESFLRKLAHTADTPARAMVALDAARYLFIVARPSRPAGQSVIDFDKNLLNPALKILTQVKAEPARKVLHPDLVQMGDVLNFNGPLGALVLASMIRENDFTKFLDDDAILTQKFTLGDGNTTTVLNETIFGRDRDLILEELRAATADNERDKSALKAVSKMYDLANQHLLESEQRHLGLATEGLKNESAGFAYMAQRDTYKRGQTLNRLAVIMWDRATESSIPSKPLASNRMQGHALRVLASYLKPYEGNLDQKMASMAVQALYWDAESHDTSIELRRSWQTSFILRAEGNDPQHKGLNPVELIALAQTLGKVPPKERNSDLQLLANTFTSLRMNEDSPYLYATNHLANLYDLNSVSEEQAHARGPLIKYVWSKMMSMLRERVMRLALGSS